jgi:hypothetical protein
MARLSEREKEQLLTATRRKTRRAPRAPARPPRDVLEFATFASTFAPVVKPVRFGGQHWKL